MKRKESKITMDKESRIVKGNRRVFRVSGMVVADIKAEAYEVIKRYVLEEAERNKLPF